MLPFSHLPPPRLSPRDRTSRAAAPGAKAAVLCLLFGLAALPLRAQLDLTEYREIALPVGHSYLINTHFDADTDRVLVFTTDEVYTLSDFESAPYWQKIRSLPLLSTRPLTQSAVAAPYVEDGASYWLVNTINSDDQFSVYKVRENLPAQTHSPLTQFEDLAKDMNRSPDGRLFLIDQSSQLWRADNPADWGTTTRLTDAVSNIRKLSFGSDGTVYALDSGNQVFRFSTDGELLSQYTLSLNTNTVDFVVGRADVLYSLDLGSNYSGIYDAVTGGYLGRFEFDIADITDPRSFGGRPDIAFESDPTTGRDYLVAQTGTGGYLHFYDVTGVTAIPEPSTYAALAGLAGLALAVIRRRTLA